MAYKRVVSLDADNVVKIGGVDKKTNKPNPTQVEGYYLGFRTFQSENGESKIQVFQTPKGNLGVWGTTDLDRKLSQVSPGTMTLVEYKGIKKLKGNKTLHTYEVSQDGDNCIEAGTATVQADSTGGSTLDEDYADENTESNDYTDGADEDTAQTQALLAAEAAAKKAKVQEILNRGKNKKA